MIAEAQQDKQLAETIIRDELRGILHWAIWGLARLQRQGRFTVARKSEEARVQYRRDNDPIGTFLREEVVKGGTVFCDDLRQAFINWNPTVIEQLDSKLTIKRIKRSFAI